MAPISEDDHGVAEELAKLYLVNYRRLLGLRSVLNVPYKVAKFNVTHYISYLMEEGSDDNSPVYILYYLEDPEVMESLRGSISLLLAEGGNMVSRAHPQSYEEGMLAKVFDIGETFGCKPFAYVTRTSAFKGAWVCRAGGKNRFKDEFYKVSRANSMKVV